MDINSKPKFTIIMVDYEGAATRNELRRAIECFTNQTYKNFELLIYHDGPKTQSYEEDLRGCTLPKNIKFFETDARENNWGHSNRNRGIYEASGEWIIHTNADNVFYSYALYEMAAAIEFENWAVSPNKSLTTEWDALVFPIIMKGYSAFKRKLKRFTNETEKLSVVLSGIPIRIIKLTLCNL